MISFCHATLRRELRDDTGGEGDYISYIVKTLRLKSNELTLPLFPNPA